LQLKQWRTVDRSERTEATLFQLDATKNRAIAPRAVRLTVKPVGEPDAGSMSADGKRSVAAWPKLPRPSSTLPELPSRDVSFYGEYWRVSGPSAGVLSTAALDPNRTLALRPVA
jgi:hypothetical protein